MKIVGLITEYNPFHNGHLYHIEEAKRVTGADAALVVMSGDYVQRGMPAIMPKRLRAEMALKCGAAAVFELPLCYATGSAELFALGAVSLLDRLGIVDSLCFGSESGDLAALEKAADILTREPAEYRALLKKHLKHGCSYPTARQNALSEYLNDPSCASLLADPNNILGIEYLKALRKLGSPLRPYTIQRKGAHYHDQTFSPDHYSSASAIRSLLAHSGSALRTDSLGGSFEDPSFSSILTGLEGQVPDCCLELLKDFHKVTYPVYPNDFSLLLKYKLLNKHPENLVRYMDVSEELANRICSQLDNFFNYRQFCELLKTRELTQTRINRALLHIMLGTKKSSVRTYRENGFHYYARLLGFRRDQGSVVAAAAKKSSLPLLIRLSDSGSLPETGKLMLRNNILASSLYMSVVTDKFRTAFQNEYRQPVLKV